MNNHDNNPKYIQIRGARVHNLKNINACAASAAGNSGDPEYVWHGNGAFEQSAADVFEAGFASVSQWALCGADIKSGSGAGDFLPNLWGAGAAAECGRTCV